MNKLNRVLFPDVVGQRHYMRQFFKADGLPFDLKEWQPTVDAMLEGVNTEAPIFFMVDQGFVHAGQTLRRPGLHIDGHWCPGVVGDHEVGHRLKTIYGSHTANHGVPSGGHKGDQSTPGFISPNEWERRNKKSQVTRVPKRKKRDPDTDPMPPVDDNTWILNGVDYDEGIILASNIAGCIGYDQNAPFGIKGDCSHIDVSGVRSEMMVDGFAYGIDVSQLHESVPQLRAGYRTVVRLNVPGWRPL